MRILVQIHFVNDKTVTKKLKQMNLNIYFASSIQRRIEQIKTPCTIISRQTCPRFMFCIDHKAVTCLPYQNYTADKNKGDLLTRNGVCRETEMYSMVH